MNRETFFNAIRPAFGSLNVKQIEGMEALLDAGRDLPLHHMANVLAQVRRETGGYMSPIKETVMPHHKNKNPTDAEVIRRLDRAFAAGKLKWVKTPYWRDGWFGRGQIQLTHRANYAKFGISNPADAMLPHISAHIAVAGMAGGMFTGRKLADYAFPAALDAPPANNPRRIVNGQDGSDREVARHHREFAAALNAAGWKPAPQRPATPPVAATPAQPATGLLTRILAALVAILKGRNT
jgi:predicted chitinase